jgi:flavin reductase (DIM6/NTAB) family NADH-FMN oxidoreductase RutF
VEVRNPEGLDVIVVAAVTDAIMGSCWTVRVTYCGRQYGQPIPGWPILPSYPIPSVLVRTMEILKRVPTQVWIVTGDSASGTRCGVTAGSVASSATSPNLLTFNLLKTSAFYATFCGIGTVIRLFMVAAGHMRLAEKFFKTVGVSAADMGELLEHAAFALDVVVEQAETVLDHLLVVCRVRQVVSLRAADDCQPVRTPLLRVARGYTRLGQSEPDTQER